MEAWRFSLSKFRGVKWSEKKKVKKMWLGVFLFWGLCYQKDTFGSTISGKDPKGVMGYDGKRWHL